jgi:7-carboxy-7-deazaguanine synthase
MRVFSIFQSIDGEVSSPNQGIPSTFLRLSGCSLRCSYCDIPEAQDPKAGQEMTVDEVVQIIRRYECPKITITGGEPLLQEDEIHILLNRLFPYGHKISIETNGTISTERFRNLRKPNPDICLVVDYKFQQSDPYAFAFLQDWDWVKIVVGGREDFDEARRVFEWMRELGCKARFALSPIHETLSGKMLAGWILDAKMWDVTLNCQIHKFLSVE